MPWLASAVMCLGALNSEKICAFCFTTYLKYKVLHNMRKSYYIPRDKNIYFCFSRLSSQKIASYIRQSGDGPFLALLIGCYFDSYREIIEEISKMPDDYQGIRTMAKIGIEWHDENINTDFYQYYQNFIKNLEQKQENKAQVDENLL